jgi:hypothetical protein
MALSLEGLDFLSDPALDPEIKKLLLAGVFEERRQKRDIAQRSEDSKTSQEIERKRFWHNTPLMLALVGTISVFASGLVAYVQAARTTSDTITLKELEGKLKESEGRSSAERERQIAQLRQQWSQEASEAEARRTATREERAFEFKIIEQELAKTGEPAARAQVLLFLVRAKIVTSLDRDELQKMAIAEYKSATGKEPGPSGIPPTLGSPGLTFVGVEAIDPQKVLIVDSAVSNEFGEYSQVYQTSGESPAGALGVREPAEPLIKRLGLEGAFAKLTRPDQGAVWVRTDAVIRVRNVLLGEPGAGALDIGNFKRFTMEDDKALLARLKVSPPLAQLTTPGKGPIWLKGAAVSGIISGEENTRLTLTGGVPRFQFVREDASTARRIVNAHGGKIGLGEAGNK